MTKFLTNLIISGIAVGLAAYFTPGVSVDGLWTAIIVVLVLGIVNATIGAVLRFFTFPLNFLTLGLISALICFGMILLTDSLVDGFAIANWMSGIIFAILLGLISSFLGVKKH